MKVVSDKPRDSFPTAMKCFPSLLSSWIEDHCSRFQLSDSSRDCGLVLSAYDYLHRSRPPLQLTPSSDLAQRSRCGRPVNGNPHFRPLKGALLIYWYSLTKMSTMATWTQVRWFSSFKKMLHYVAGLESHIMFPDTTSAALPS